MRTLLRAFVRTNAEGIYRNIPRNICEDIRRNIRRYIPKNICEDIRKYIPEDNTCKENIRKDNIPLGPTLNPTLTLTLYSSFILQVTHRDACWDAWIQKHSLVNILGNLRNLGGNIIIISCLIKLFCNRSCQKENKKWKW